MSPKSILERAVAVNLSLSGGQLERMQELAAGRKLSHIFREAIDEYLAKRPRKATPAPEPAKPPPALHSLGSVEVARHQTRDVIQDKPEGTP